MWCSPVDTGLRCSAAALRFFIQVFRLQTFLFAFVQLFPLSDYTSSPVILLFQFMGFLHALTSGSPVKPAGVSSTIVSYSQHRGPSVSLPILRVQPNLPVFMPDGVYSACRDIAVITRVHKDEAPTFFVLKLFFPAEWVWSVLCQNCW